MMRDKFSTFGIGQNVRLEWMEMALGLASSGLSVADCRAKALEHICGVGIKDGVARGKESAAKAMQMLRVWFAPKDDMKVFVRQLVTYAPSCPQEERVCLHWAILAEQARKVGGIGGSMLQSMVNKLVDMGQTRRTSVEEIADVIGGSIACTRELLGIFSAAGRFEELEELKRCLEFGDREGGSADLVSRTERKVDGTLEMKKIDGEIDRLDRLLSEVIRDHIEAAEEGWPDADLKYDDLESQIRDAIKTSEELRRRFKRPLSDS